MTLIAKVKNGAIVLSEPLQIPDDTEINIDITPRDNDAKSLSETLMKFAGTVTDSRKDGSVNHDHYLYGTPKK